MKFYFVLFFVLIIGRFSLADGPTITGSQVACQGKCLWIEGWGITDSTELHMKFANSTSFSKRRRNLLNYIPNKNGTSTIIYNFTKAELRRFPIGNFQVKLRSAEGIESATITLAPGGFPLQSGFAEQSAGARLTFFDGFDSRRSILDQWSKGYAWTPFPNDTAYFSNSMAIKRRGLLEIGCQFAPKDIQKSDGTFAHRDFGCGGVRTEKKFSQKYGYFESRAKVASARGLNSAFWLAPDSKFESQPNTIWWLPEIDIFEILSKGLSKAYFTNHYVINGKAYSNQESFKGPNFSEDFHTFAVDWTPTQLTYYVDGVARANSTEGVPQEKLMVLFTTLTGGNWAGTASPEDLPSKMYVDYVRIFDRKPNY